MKRRETTGKSIVPVRAGVMVADGGAIGAGAVGTASVGALGAGALAFGALAVGALAIGRLVIGSARLRRVEIGELTIRTLRVGGEDGLGDTGGGAVMDDRPTGRRPTGSGVPRLAAVGNVFYFVEDLDAAVKWYSERLSRKPVVTGSALAAFDVEGTRLTLHRSDDLNSGGRTGVAAYWTVPDVDAFVEEWARHGATPHRGPKTVFTGERLCQLVDPFGNIFAVRQAVGMTATS